MGWGLKARARALVNRTKRVLHVGQYWYWLPPGRTPASIPIRDLVYPLRYDILVRRDLFLFLREHRDRWQPDALEPLVELLRDHPYRLWVEHVLVPRYRPHGVGDPAVLREALLFRLRESAALYASMEARGFDTAHPIVPFTAETILPTGTDLAPPGPFFMGDGCHRLACLMAMGYTELPAAFMRIKCFRTARPFDNTTLLAPHLPIAWPPEFIQSP